MPLSAIVISAIVWGGLMIYFLVPFDDKISVEGTFPQVFIVSLKKLLFHKKAFLAFVLLMITVMSIRFYFQSAEEYDKLHAITRESAAAPQEQAMFYITSIVMYTVFLYLFLAVRWTVRAVKRR